MLGRINRKYEENLFAHSVVADKYRSKPPPCIGARKKLTPTPDVKPVIELDIIGHNQIAESETELEFKSHTPAS